MSEIQVTPNFKVARVRSKAHLHLVSYCGCVVPGCRWHWPIEQALKVLARDGITRPEPNPYVTWHHVRRASNAGTAVKPGDDCTIGTCDNHHREIHQAGEKTCAARWGIDLMDCAERLAEASRAMGVLAP